MCDDPRKVSTAMCADFFEDMGRSLELLNNTRNQFNPTQRRLIGRFLVACKVFGRQMLVADGVYSSVNEVCGLSNEKPNRTPSIGSVKKSIVGELCEGVQEDIGRIRESTQDGLLNGVAFVIEEIRKLQGSESPALDAFDAISMLVKHSANQIDTVFDLLMDTVEKTNSVYSNVPMGSITAVEEFMQRIVPDKKEYRTDYLHSFFDDIEALVNKGYSWKQIANYLESQGIETNYNAVANFYRREISEG